MRNCSEPQLPGLGSWRGSTRRQQGKRNWFPFNPSYGHVYSAMRFSSEVLQSSKGTGNGWNSNQMPGQHSYTAWSSSSVRDKIGTATEQRNSPFGTSAQNKAQKAQGAKQQAEHFATGILRWKRAALWIVKRWVWWERWAAVQCCSQPAPPSLPKRATGVGMLTEQITESRPFLAPTSSKQLFDRARSWVCTGVCRKHQSNHCKPVTSCICWLGARPACHCSGWCVHCHICRSTRCHLGVIWNSATPLDLLAIFPRQLWALG